MLLFSYIFGAHSLEGAAMKKAVILIGIGLWLGGCTESYTDYANSTCQARGLQPGTPQFTRCFFETRDHALALSTGAAIEAPGVWQATPPPVAPAVSQPGPPAGAAPTN